MYQIPEKIPTFGDRPYCIERYVMRDKYIKEGMFGFVSWKWVNPFVKWINNRKCLEVMAGRGILSYALKQKGVNIITTDDFSWHTKEEFKQWNNSITEIEKIDAIEAIKKYGKEVNIVIMSWPYMDNTAYQVLKTLYEVNPFVYLVFIGEHWGGCTADDEFFQHFEEIEDENFQVVNEKYERWFGLHDYMMLGRYKK